MSDNFFHFMLDEQQLQISFLTRHMKDLVNVEHVPNRKVDCMLSSLVLHDACK